MAKRKDTEDQAGASRPGPSSSRRTADTAAWVTLALLIGLVGGYLLGRFQPSPPPAPPAPLAQNATEAKREASLAQRADQADQALAKAYKSLRPDAPALHPHSTEQRENAGQPYQYRSYRLQELDVQALHERLVKELATLAPGATLTRVSPETWDISIEGLPTHRLRLGMEAAKPETPGKPAKARLAIVIDDMGEDVAAAKELSTLSGPVAFSVWPDSSHREAVLKIAKAAGREILIHLPMQPKGFPMVNPGPHALLVSMPPETIKAKVDRAVARVHGAIGVNNHMGSEFTESNLGMRLALTELQAKGLFFLDSRTSAGTVGLAEAKHLGMRAYQRDVFLDNVLKVPAILKQLRQAETMAKEKGQAIAIGHPHKETIAAIKQWLREKDGSVQLVTVSSLAPR